MNRLYGPTARYVRVVLYCATAWYMLADGRPGWAAFFAAVGVVWLIEERT